MTPHSSRLRKSYFNTFIALLSLLALTFLMAHFDLGPLGTVTGLFIAGVKAGLVALYFMHLRHPASPSDQRSLGVYRIAAGAGIFWLGILVSLVLTDVLSRNWLFLPGSWP